MALPADEGRDAAGADLLPAADRLWLRTRGYRYSATLDRNFINVVLCDYPLPPGFDRDMADLLIRLPATWPDGAPDMFWFEPYLRTGRTGGWPDRADQFQAIAGRTWQRWSRHLHGGWRSGVDGLANYLAIVDRALAEAAK